MCIYCDSDIFCVLVAKASGSSSYDNVEQSTRHPSHVLHMDEFLQMIFPAMLSSDVATCTSSLFHYRIRPGYFQSKKHKKTTYTMTSIHTLFLIWKEDNPNGCATLCTTFMNTFACWMFICENQYYLLWVMKSIHQDLTGPYAWRSKRHHLGGKGVTSHLRLKLCSRFTCVIVISSPGRTKFCYPKATTYHVCTRKCVGQRSYWDTLKQT